MRNNNEIPYIGHTLIVDKTPLIVDQTLDKTWDIPEIKGKGLDSIGYPPEEAEKDWLAIIQ